MGDLDTQGGGKYRTIEDGVITSVDGGNTFSIKVAGRDYDYVGVNGTWYDADNVEGEDVRIGFIQGSSKLPVLITRGSRPRRTVVASEAPRVTLTWYNPVEGDESGRGHSSLVEAGVVPDIDGESTLILEVGGDTQFDLAYLGLYEEDKAFVLIANLDTETFEYQGVDLVAVGITSQLELWRVNLPDYSYDTFAPSRVWWINDLRVFLVQDGGNYDFLTGQVDTTNRNRITILNEAGTILLQDTIEDLGEGLIGSVAADGTFFAAKNDVRSLKVTSEPWGIELIETVIEANEAEPRTYTIKGRTESGDPVCTYLWFDDDFSETELGVTKGVAILRSSTYDWEPYWVNGSTWIGWDTASGIQRTRGTRSVSASVIGDRVVGSETKPVWHNDWANFWGWFGPGPNFSGTLQTRRRAGYVDTEGLLFSELTEEEQTWEGSIEIYGDAAAGAPYTNAYVTEHIHQNSRVSARWPCASGFIEAADPKPDVVLGPAGKPRLTRLAFSLNRDWELDDWTQWSKFSAGNPRSIKYAFRDATTLQVLHEIDTGVSECSASPGNAFRGVDQVTICDNGSEGWAFIDNLCGDAANGLDYSTLYPGRRVLVRWTREGESLVFSHEESENQALGGRQGTAVRYPRQTVGIGNEILTLTYRDGSWKLDRYR